MQHCFENHGSVAECVRKFRTNFGRREAPSAPYFHYLVKKEKETGILIDKPKREKPKTVRAAENIAAVAESQHQHQFTVVLNFFLHKNLGMTPYKVQLVQELKPNYHPVRVRFAKWACDRHLQ